ncbi:hypothetical protein MASR1M74_27640 [Lentimicrobium sp.]
MLKNVKQVIENKQGILQSIPGEKYTHLYINVLRLHDYSSPGVTESRNLLKYNKNNRIL